MNQNIVLPWICSHQIIPAAQKPKPCVYLCTWGPATASSLRLVQKAKKKKKKVRALDMQEVAVFALWIPPRVRANTRALAGGTALNVHTAHCKKCAAKEKVNKPLVICLKREKRDIYK